MFAHMRHHPNLHGSRDGKDGLLDIVYADPAKYIQAIWGQKNFWKAIGTAWLSLWLRPTPPCIGACELEAGVSV